MEYDEDRCGKNQSKCNPALCTKIETDVTEIRRKNISPLSQWPEGLFGPSDRVRTCGLMVPNHPRYQLRHTRLYLFLVCSLLIIFLLSVRGASLRNIVAALRLERSLRSLFLHLGAMPSSAPGGGIPPRPAAPHPVIFIFSLFPAYYLSAVRPRRFPQKHSRGSSLGALAPLLVSSPRSNASIRPRRRHSSSPNCATPGYIYILVCFLLISFPLSVRGASLRNIVA